MLDKGSGLTKMGLSKRGNVGSALESQNDLGWKGLLKIWLNPAAMDRDSFHVAQSPIQSEFEYFH